MHIWFPLFAPKLEMGKILYNLAIINQSELIWEMMVAVRLLKLVALEIVVRRMLYTD